MAEALPFFSIIGTAFSVISSISQGQNAKRAADYNAQINAQNAQIAQRNAADQNVQNTRENYLRLGAIRAAQGKSGGTGDSGSVLDVLGDVAGQGELDKQYTTYQGNLAARGYTNTAQLDTVSGQNAQTAGYLKAGAELMGGIGDYYYNKPRLVRR